MSRAQRWRILLETVGARGRLSATEAAAMLQVSLATIRRDFGALADQQLVTRTHGGVVAASIDYELPARYRQSSPGGATEQIAATAAALVEPGQVIAFNGGLTTSATARHVAARSDLANGSTNGPSLTVLTNALNIARDMVIRPHIRTVTLGGVARPHAYELTGPHAAQILREYWVDTLFLGVDGLCPVAGASTHHTEEAGVNAAMVQRSQRVIVVAGAEKLGARTFARICDVERVHDLVTDAAADPAMLDAFRDCGVTVHAGAQSNS